MSDIKKKQLELLNSLQPLNPRRPILVQHHLRQEWHPWKECPHEEPFLTRSVLLNEVVFDFDCPDWAVIVEEAGKLVRYLEANRVPHLLASSGGKGLHIHIFLDLAVHITEEQRGKLERYGIDPFSLARVLVAESLIDDSGLDAVRAGIDWTKIRWSALAKGSMIRDFGARRDDGRVKSLMGSIPAERPSIAEPRFPDGIELWPVRHLAPEIERCIGAKIEKAEEHSFEPASKTPLSKYPCYQGMMAGLGVGKRQLGAFNIALWNKSKGVPQGQAEKDLLGYVSRCEGADDDLRRESLATLRRVYSSQYRGVSCEAVRTNLSPELCHADECPLFKKGERVVHRLMRLVDEADAEPFCDEHGDCYLSYDVRGHREVRRADGQEFRNWLITEYWRRYQDAPHDDGLKAVVAVQSAKAMASGTRIKLSVRLARHGEDVYLDLGDETWAAVRAFPGGWEVVDRPPVLFRRTAGMLPLPRPTKGGRATDILSFTRLSDRDLLILPVLLISYLVPGFPHPIAQFIGPPGSIKSTTAELMKNAIDPNVVSRGGMTKSVEDFAQQFDHNYVTLLDNLSSLPKEYSDRACKAATGEAFMKRALYTNDGVVVYKYLRCVLVTSIGIVNHSDDFLERSIIFQMEMLPDELRRSEDEVRGEFGEALPSILGGMLDVLAEAMRTRPTLKLRNLPRMADFALWGEAISQALGNEELRFYRAYKESLADRNEEALCGHPVGLAVLRLMEERDRFIGTMSELLDCLNGVATRYGIDTSDRWWPRGGNWLSVRLEGMRQSLHRQGIVFRMVPGWTVKDDYRMATGMTLETRNATVVIMERRAAKPSPWFDEPAPPSPDVQASQAIQDRSETSASVERDGN